MVHVKAKTKYGGLNEVRKSTTQFIRDFRALMYMIERVSTDYNCSPEASLLLLSEHLPLGKFTPVDEPIHLDIRREEQELREFLSKAYVNPQTYLLSVIEYVLRLPTKNMTEIIGLFEVARMKLGGFKDQAVRQQELKVEKEQVVRQPEPKEMVGQSEPETETEKEVENIQKILKTSETKVSDKRMAQLDPEEETDDPEDDLELDESEDVEETVEPRPKRKFKTKKVEPKEPVKTKPVEKQPKKTTKPVVKQPEVPNPLSKLDEVLNRGKATLAKSKETLAETGQVVSTNPLLNDFL